MKILLVTLSLQVVLMFGIAFGEEANPRVKYPGELFRPGDQKTVVPPDCIYLIVKSGYIHVQIFKQEDGYLLSLVDYGMDGKPHRTLQERSGKVYLIQDNKETSLAIKNRSGALMTRRPLPDQDFWKLKFQLKGHVHLNDEAFAFEYKREWLELVDPLRQNPENASCL